jgi:hypothetical protein
MLTELFVTIIYANQMYFHIFINSFIKFYYGKVFKYGCISANLLY